MLDTSKTVNLVVDAERAAGVVVKPAVLAHAPRAATESDRLVDVGVDNTELQKKKDKKSVTSWQI